MYTQQPIRQLTKQPKSVSNQQPGKVTSGILLKAHQECEIEYEQSFQALDLDEDEQNHQKSILTKKSKSQQKQVLKNQIRPRVSNDSSLLERHNSERSSSSQASNSSTSSPSSSSSLIMDTKDLYEYNLAGAASPTSEPILTMNDHKKAKTLSNNNNMSHQLENVRNSSVSKKSGKIENVSVCNQNNVSACSTPTNVTPIPRLSSSGIKKIKAVSTVSVEHQRDSGFIEAVSSSILSLNDEEPNQIVARKPPLRPLKVSAALPQYSLNHGRSFDDSGIGIQEREQSFNNSTSTETSEEKCIGMSRRSVNTATKMVSPLPNKSSLTNSTHICNVNMINANVNTVLFNNDENSLMNSKEISMSKFRNDEFAFKNTNFQLKPVKRITEDQVAVIKNVERKFTSAMQKASHIENIINKPQNNISKNSVQNQNDQDRGQWIKRQICSNECQTPQSPSVITNSMEKTYDFVQQDQEDSDSIRSKSFVNSEEYQFFINAIEKLKATNLFHEEDIKRMSDEQIYDALVEHARKQKLKQRLMAAHQLSMSTAASSSLAHPSSTINQPSSAVNVPQLESIDPKEDEEDLPIIMKNLHSVKSLKHFFEIRAKSKAALTLGISQPFNNSSGDHHFIASNTNSPQLNIRNTKSELSTLPSESPPSPQPNTSSSYDMFIKSSNPLIEKSIKHGIGLVHKDVEEEFKTNKSIISSTTTIEIKQLPIAPPLPDFLTQPSSTSSLIQTKLSSSKTSNTPKTGTLTSNSSASNTAAAGVGGDSSIFLNSKEMIYNQDLHEKLIKEIHNKSLERSKKDSSIFLDEHGNLINRPTNRVYSSSSTNSNLNQFKLHKLGNRFKDSQHSVIAEKITQLTQKKNNKSVNELPVSKFVSRMIKPNAALTTASSQVSEQFNTNADLTSASSHSKVSSTQLTIPIEENEKIIGRSVSNNLNSYKNSPYTNHQRNTSIVSSDCSKIEKLKLAVETTTTMISLNIDESKQEATAGPAAVLATLPAVTSASNVANTTNEEINDSYVMITKSVVMNQFNGVEESANSDSSRVVQKNIDQINDEIKKDKMSMMKLHRQIDETSEIMSISQVPSVMQTLERKNQIIQLINGHATPAELSNPQKNFSSLTANNFNVLTNQPNTNNNSISSNTNNNHNQPSSNHPSIDYKRATSIRSDFSTMSSQSGVSTRSMLSEAKAKLEAFSGKVPKVNISTNYLNNNNNSVFDSQNNQRVINDSKKDHENNSRDEQNYYETCDFIQTKF